MSDGHQRKHTFLITSEKQFDPRSRSLARAHAASWSRAQGRRKSSGRPAPESGSSSNVLTNYNPTSSKGKSKAAPVIFQDEEEVTGFPCANCTPERAVWCSSGECAYLKEIDPNRMLSITQDVQIGNKLDPFGALPQGTSENRQAVAMSSVKRHVSNFIGQDFLTQAITGNDGRSQLLYSASMLLAYAHYTALTGRRAGPELLELKGDVLRSVNAALTKSPNTVSLDVGFGIATLSLQVVGIATAQSSALPSRARREGTPEEEDEVAADHTALRDHLMHRNTMIKLLKDVWSKQDLRTARVGRYLLVLSTLSGALASAATAYSPAFSEEDLPANYACRPSVAIREMWHSPFYWQRTPHIESSSKNPAKKLLSELLQAVSDWLATFDLDYSADFNGDLQLSLDRETYRHRIESFESYTGSVAQETGHVYECCRLVAQLMLRAEANCCSLQEAAGGTTLIAAVAYSLRKTDIYSLWGSQIGLLFWVVTVCQVADTASGFRLSLITTIVNCIMHKVATSDVHIEVALRPLQKLKWFNALCCAEDSRPINKMVQLCQFMRVSEDEEPAS